MSLIKHLSSLGVLILLSVPLMAEPSAEPKQLEARKDLVEAVIEINKAQTNKGDLTKARTLIEKAIEMGDIEAMKLKVRGLLNGEYGYPKDPEAGYELARKNLITNLDEIKHTDVKDEESSK